MSSPFDRLRAELVSGIDTFEKRRIRRRRILATTGGLVAIGAAIAGSYVFVREDSVIQVVADDPDATASASGSDGDASDASGRPPGPLPRDAFVIDDTTVLFWEYFDQLSDPVRGFSFDVTTGELAVLPDPPRASAQDRSVAWTGTELIICCGERRAQAFDPATSTWRDLASPPGPGHGFGEWTGTEVVQLRNGEFEIFDPAQDRWDLFDVPAALSLRFPWYDTELVGPTGDRGERVYFWPRPPQRTAHNGWYYDLGDLSWNELPPIPTEGRPAIVSIEWADDRLIVGGGLPAASGGSERFVLWQLVDGNDTWEQIDLDVGEPDPCECNLGSQALLWTGEELLVHLGALSSGVSANGAVWSVDLETGNSVLLATDPYVLEPVVAVGDQVLWRDADGTLTVGPATLPNDIERAAATGTSTPVEVEAPPPTPTPDSPGSLCEALLELDVIELGSVEWALGLLTIAPLMDDVRVADAVERYVSAEQFGALSTLLDGPRQDLQLVDQYLSATCPAHDSFGSQLEGPAPGNEDIATERIFIPGSALPQGYGPAGDDPAGTGTSEAHVISLLGTTVEMVVTTFHDSSFDWREFGSEGDADDTALAINGNPAVAFDGAEGIYAPGAGWSVQWGEGSEYGVLVFAPAVDLDQLVAAIDRLVFGSTGLEISQLPGDYASVPVRSILSGFWPPVSSTEPGDDDLVLRHVVDPDRSVAVTVSNSSLDTHTSMMAILGAGGVEILPLTGPDGEERSVWFSTAGEPGSEPVIWMAAWQEDVDSMVTIWSFDPAVDVLGLATELEVT